MQGDGRVAAEGNSPPQQVAKSFVAKLDSPMAGSVTSGRPFDDGLEAPGEGAGEAQRARAACAEEFATQTCRVGERFGRGVTDGGRVAAIPSVQETTWEG